MVPVRHPWIAHTAIPGSLLEIFEGASHYPFHDDPRHFIDVVQSFLYDTEPAEYNQAALRELLHTGGSELTVTNSANTHVTMLNTIVSDKRSAT